MYVLDGPYKILSDTVPAYIHTYYQQGNLYYKIQIHPENTDVSDEVWLSFGIEKYVPPETQPQPDNITE